MSMTVIFILVTVILPFLKNVTALYGFLVRNLKWIFKTRSSVQKSKETICNACLGVDYLQTLAAN